MVTGSKSGKWPESLVSPRLRGSVKVWAAGLILVTSGYLTLTGLDNTYFWDDEATVSIVAKNFLSTYQFTGWDGRNLYAYRNGTTLDRDLNVHEPPLDILVAALSFGAFSDRMAPGLAKRAVPAVVENLYGTLFAIVQRQRGRP